jgi:hypothetical protein
MNSSRRLRVPILLSGVLAVLLFFVASASAETRTGESSSPFDHGATDPETTIVKGSASYESTSGSIRFDVTTAAAPQPENESGEKSHDTLMVGLASPAGPCDLQTLLALESNPQAVLPLAEIIAPYSEPNSAIGGVLSTYPPVGSPTIPAEKRVSGTTTTLGLTTSAAAELGFNCAIAETSNSTGDGSLLVFPITAPPPPPPAPPAPVPAPAPALSIAKLKPLNLKAGKHRTVKVRVTNTGAAATAQGSLRVKGAKGVLVKPERQKLPALTPGTSWTLTFRVQLTAKAKKKSKLHLTGSASGVKFKGTLVVKRKGSAVKHRHRR